MRSNFAAISIALATSALAAPGALVNPRQVGDEQPGVTCDVLQNPYFGQGLEYWGRNVYGDDMGSTSEVTTCAGIPHTVWDSTIETNDINVGLGQDFTRCSTSSTKHVKMVARKVGSNQASIQVGIVKASDIPKSPPFQSGTGYLTEDWKEYDMALALDEYDENNTTYLLNWYTHKVTTDRAAVQVAYIQFYEES